MGRRYGPWGALLLALAADVSLPFLYPTYWVNTIVGGLAFTCFLLYLCVYDYRNND